MNLKSEGSWMNGLLSETFFSPCVIHVKKCNRNNDATMFCLQCCTKLCFYCDAEGLHKGHTLLRVRRYVYNDVIKVGDLSNVYDPTSIQTYTINKARAVFLHQRPQATSYKTSLICKTCYRYVRDDFEYCCLACKVEYQTGKHISNKKFNGEDLKLVDVRVDSGEDGDGQVTPNSVLAPFCFSGSASLNASSASSNDIDGVGGKGDGIVIALSCTATSSNNAPVAMPVSPLGYDENNVSRKKRSVTPKVKRTEHEAAIAASIRENYAVAISAMKRAGFVLGSRSSACKRKGKPVRSPLLL